jgi:hypothetical protein
MMTECGRYLPLSLPRRLLNDMLHFPCQVPSVPVEGPTRVGRVQNIRKRPPQRLGWCAFSLRLDNHKQLQCSLHAAASNLKRKKALHEHVTPESFPHGASQDQPRTNRCNQTLTSGETDVNRMRVWPVTSSRVPITLA